MSTGEEDCGGYSYDFVDFIPERFICSICTKVMKDPHLMLCCGIKYCGSCLLNWFDAQGFKSCPLCRAQSSEEPILHAQEKGMKREINSIFIYCPNKTVGCSWQGELGDVKQHLIQCGYVKIDCPNLCQSESGITIKVLRKDLQKHLTRLCDMRTEKCKLCGCEDIVKYHAEVCRYFPVECPNKCGSNYLIRGTVKHHLLSHCPLEIIRCTNKYNGCEDKVQRQNLRDHLVHHCKQRLIKCKYCDQQIRAKNFSVHRGICKKYPVECPNKCGEIGLIRSILPEHISQCKSELIQCEYAIFGCMCVTTRIEMAHHLRANKILHLKMATRMYRKQAEALESVRQKYQDQLLVTKKGLELHLSQSVHLNSIATVSSHVLNSRDKIYFRMLEYTAVKNKTKDWQSPTMTYQSPLVKLRIRAFFSYSNLVVQVRVIELEYPFRLQQSIHLELSQQIKTEESTAVLTTPAKIRLEQGCLIGRSVLFSSIDNWEAVHVRGDSLLWIITLK